MMPLFDDIIVQSQHFHLANLHAGPVDLDSFTTHKFAVAHCGTGWLAGEILALACQAIVPLYDDKIALACNVTLAGFT
jgi:hypothetical protein